MLNGRTAVVTGGGRGIGAAICLAFAKAGADIAIIYAGNESAANETKQNVIALGVKCEAYKCNVASHDETKSTVASIIKEFGGIDILVNNAGVTKDGLIMAMKEQDFDSVLDVNLKGAFNMTKHVTSHLIKKRYGRIVNITSVSGICGIAGQANYSAAKAGLIGLTKATAKELGARGVTVNAVAPGFIETDMTSSLSENIKETVLSSTALKRMGSASEVANLVLFLASDSASYITGEVIRIDGGLAI